VYREEMKTPRDRGQRGPAQGEGRGGACRPPGKAVRKKKKRKGGRCAHSAGAKAHGTERVLPISGKHAAGVGGGSNRYCGKRLNELLRGS